MGELYMYKNYIFDLYGTLIDIHTDENREIFWEKLALHYSYHGSTYSSTELRNSYNAEVKRELNKNKLTNYPDIAIEKVIKKLFKEKGVKSSVRLVTETMQLFRILSTDYIKLYDGVKETLEQLKEAGKKLYILSNGQRLFSMPELKYLGIADLFDGIYFSADICICKPDTAFYKYLLDKEQLLIEESIMIGNDHTTDIEGAKRLGMKSIYIHSNLSQTIHQVDSTYSIWDNDFKKVASI
jgi:putative hydrolase of the HAD superfamily